MENVDFKFNDKFFFLGFKKLALKFAIRNEMRKGLIALSGAKHLPCKSPSGKLN
jgi:hypothetical protein